MANAFHKWFFRVTFLSQSPNGTSIANTALWRWANQSPIEKWINVRMKRKRFLLCASNCIRLRRSLLCSTMTAGFAVIALAFISKSLSLQSVLDSDLNRLLMRWVKSIASPSGMSLEWKFIGFASFSVVERFLLLAINKPLLNIHASGSMPVVKISHSYAVNDKQIFTSFRRLVLLFRKLLSSDNFSQFENGKSQTWQLRIRWISYMNKPQQRTNLIFVVVLLKEAEFGRGIVARGECLKLNVGNFHCNIFKNTLQMARKWFDLNASIPS